MKLKQQHKDAISAAIDAAQKKTSARIIPIIMQDSDILQNHSLVYGLFLGTVIALACWYFRILSYFPALLAVQLAPSALLQIFSSLHPFMLWLLPRRLVHYHAARRAYEHYISITHNMPATEPIVVFYISLAERYTHILTNHWIREKIPYSQWKPVVDAFTASVKKDGIEKAGVAAIGRIADKIAAYFPA